MGILGNKNNPDKWKDKYFDLLDDNEDLEKTNKTKEDLLCKTIVRLSLATTGLNKQLDPHLIRIRKQLKKGLKSEQLKLELERFSNAILRLEETVDDDSLPDASLLFEFLFHHFPEQKKNLQYIEANYEKKKYANSQYLVIAINDLIDNIQHIEPITQLSETLDLLPVDTELLNTKLQHLLEDTEIPAKFESQAAALRSKLIDKAPVSSVLDETITLLFQIKKHLQTEQLEMAIFLEQLTDQLTILGVTASGVKSITESSATKRNLLDESVSSQMLELRSSSNSATQLDPLKQLINSRLENIAEQIKKQRTLEELERKKTSQELNLLTTKITAMEQESSQLASKLKSAHEKAIHDPLTNLPNRLAFDERYSIEIARWKRYKSPLSILIWDIDLFKNINDTFGHKAGDKTLILIAKLLSKYCRDTDFVSRFGGEEFTMLLSNTNAEQALETANNIREIIKKTAFNSNGKKISITISCGITQLTKADKGDSAFNRADKALYIAKNNGRNQCSVL